MEVNTTRKVIDVGHSISQKQSVASPTVMPAEAGIQAAAAGIVDDILR